MIDFHTHILPGIDDGSATLRESLGLLQLEKKAGVDTVILTPHFYAHRMSPKQFLDRRHRSWEILRRYLPEECPTMLLGAEVQYFEGIGNVENLQSLCIQATKLLLLEMPFTHWDEHILNTVKDLNAYGGVQIVLAHVERYLNDQHKNILEELNEAGIYCQINASFFDGFLKRRRAEKLVSDNLVQVIGTDCHNLDKRKPNWELVPEDVRKTLDQRSRWILYNSIIRSK